jgi:DNA-binding NtrC family response regulator
MKSKKILLVDDDELILLTLAGYLKTEGFEVDMADSGQEAIKMLDKVSSYDLIITDLRMHGEHGVDVLKKAQEVNVNLPALVISGFSKESPLFKEAIELKPSGHLFKPFSEEMFLEKVHTCLLKAN